MYLNALKMLDGYTHKTYTKNHIISPDANVNAGWIYIYRRDGTSCNTV